MKCILQDSVKIDGAIINYELNLLNNGFYQLKLSSNNLTISKISFPNIDEDEAIKSSRIAIGIIQNMIIRLKKNSNTLKFK